MLTFTFLILTYFTMFVNHIFYYFVTFSITNKYIEWFLCKSHKNVLFHKLFPFSKQSNFIYSDYFLSCTLSHPEQFPLHPQPQHPLPSFFFLCMRYRTNPPYPNIIARIKTFIILFHRLSVFFSNMRHHLFPDIPQFLKSYVPDNSSKKAPFPHNLFHLSSILLQSCFKINFKAASNKFQFTLKYILSYQPYSLFIKKNPTYALKAGGIFKFNRLFFTNHHIQNTYSISLPSSEYLPSGL